MCAAKIGERFSINYMRPTELLPDSVRMRRRIAALCFTYKTANLANLLNFRLGTDISRSGSETAGVWPVHFERLELRDVLDAITIVADGLGDKRGGFLHLARHIFAEEQVRYRIDEKGGVHFTVDEAFENERIATVSALAPGRYSSVRQSLDEAYRALDSTTPDGKAAIRSVFFACEGLFRLIYPDASQLGTSEMTKHLKPAVDGKYGGHKPAINAAQKQFKQFQDWVEGAHFYRHEPGSEEVTQPPLEIAIHYVTAGTAWLRWLQGFDMRSE